MRLRSFTAPSMSEALRLVREELGEDAVIVNSDSEPNGGVRVSAASDSHGTSPSVRPPMQHPTGLRDSAMRPADPLKEALEPHQLVGDILYSHGLSSRAQDLIMNEVEAQPAASIIDLLTIGLRNVLRFDTRPPLATLEAPLLLVGPQGAGKTTLAAKILTALRLSNDPIIAMSTDTVRAGGIGQLSAITSLLPCPLIEIEDAFALTEGLAAHHDQRCVVIDSAGVNPYEDRDMTSNAEWICAASVARPILVLPAGLDVRETSWITTAFGRAGAQSILLTRLDAARRLGGVITAAIESGLQICGMTSSANVTDAPRPLTPRLLANMLALKSDVELAEDDMAELRDNPFLEPNAGGGHFEDMGETYAPNLRNASGAMPLEAHHDNINSAAMRDPQQASNTGYPQIDADSKGPTKDLGHDFYRP